MPAPTSSTKSSPSRLPAIASSSPSSNGRRMPASLSWVMSTSNWGRLSVYSRPATAIVVQGPSGSTAPSSIHTLLQEAGQLYLVGSHDAPVGGDAPDALQDRVAGAQPLAVI